jgi:FG-GAP-like repeat
VWATTPGPLVTADFNGDGFPDLAYAHPDGRLVIALSQAAGPFAASKISTVPASIHAMVAGDVNGDGKADLVYNRAAALGVLLGNGDGTFAAGASAPATVMGPIAIGDVNGDGKLDVAAGTTFLTSSSKILVHLGDGNGGLGHGLETSTGGVFMSELALHDVNGDGRADVILGGSGLLVVYFAAADGTLSAAWNQSGSHFAVGHLNGDTIPDLVLRGHNSSASLYETVKVFTGQGNGTFTANGVQLTIAGSRLELRDFDADNISDIVTTGPSGRGIAVARGLGNGAFADSLLTVAGGSGQFVSGDFDRDGKRDVVTLTDFVASLELHRGNGDGTFRDDRGYRTGVASDGGTLGLSALDMNGDTKPDATTLLLNGNGTRTISVLRNDGSGGLLAPVLTPTTLGENVTVFLFGSIDGNSASDAVAITETDTGLTATSFLGNGNAGFTQSTVTSLTTSTLSGYRVRLVDVTGDGAADLLVNGDVYEGNGDGSFDAARETAARFDVTGDVDGNGTIDAIWADATEERLAIAMNTGGGHFSAPVYFGTSLETSGALADFDGDGELDLFSVTAKGTRVFPGNGDGTFDAGIDMAVSRPWWTTPRVADFNGDGDLDVSMGLDILLGNGDGRFRGLDFDIGSTNIPPVVADFNSDGRLDILSVGPGGFAVVHLVGLVPEPTRSSTAELRLLGQPQHAKPGSYSGIAKGTITPTTGSMLFTIGGMPVGLSVLSLTMFELPVTAASAVTSLTLPLGTYAMLTIYLGSETFMQSSSLKFVSVERAATTLQSRGSLSGVYGSPFSLGWTLNATVTEGMAGPSTTAYTLSENGVALTDLQWFDDHVVISGLAAGIHDLKLEFTGDTNYKPSSVNIPVNIAKQNPGILFEPAPAGSARVAGPVTLVARFPEQSYGSSTGTVTFLIDGSAVATVPVNALRAEHTRNMAAGVYTVKIEYSGDANNQAVSASFPMHVFGPAGTPPAVTAFVPMFAASAKLRWIPAADAASYVVYRRPTFAGAWVVVGNAFVPEANASMQPGKTWMFGVAVRYANNSIGPIGTPDIATSVPFTDDPVVPGTSVRASQITELRTAVDAVRTFAGLTAFPFTDATLTGTPIRALHLTELREALTAARNAIGMPLTFSPQAPAIGGTVKSTHIEEIRAGVR